MYEMRERLQDGPWSPWKTVPEPAQVVRDVLAIGARKCFSLKILEFGTYEYRYVQWRRKING